MLKLTETHTTTNVDVRVIGVGGAGCSSLIRLQECGSSSLSMLGIDTGSAAQNLPNDIESITIGNGFGSGGNSETAVEHFSEAELAVEDFVEEADVVIILAGLGRGTGSGLSPRIADIARRSGALTIAAVNMPFEFEGRFRNQSAVQAHSALKNATDAVITMNNDDLSKLNSASSSLNGAFQLADLNIANAVRAITTELESSPERRAAVLQSLGDAGDSVVLAGSSDGLHAGRTAVSEAFDSTSSEFSRVASVVIHVEGGIGLSLGQVAEAVTELRVKVGRRADVHVSSQRLIGMGQELKVTLVLAGIELVRQVEEQPSRLTRVKERQSVVPTVSVFETEAPKRTRGPVLLPTG
ncbi:MAG: hypothetical protein HOE43_00415 [Chloroflexi bacterium]|nr:hypothetical protein [Chloroflexota bacterium]